MEYNFTYREKDKGYQVILSYKFNGKWKQKSKQGFPTKKLAKIAGDTLLDEVKQNMELSDDYTMQGITLREFNKLFLREQNHNLEYNTRYLYDNTIEVFHQIADMPITEITYADIMDCVSTMKYKSSTQKIYVSKIKRLFKYAVSPYKLIRNNPAADISIPKDKEDKKLHALTKKELSSLLDFLYSENYIAYIMCAIAGYAGLRRGEILGLTWDNVDLSHKVITVCQQWGIVNKKEYDMKPTKSKNGNRDIPIPAILTKILEKYNTYYNSLDIIPISKRLIYKKTHDSVNNYIKKWNNETSIHDLRHTYATQLLSNGVDIRTVAALLGDTVETVMNTYIHYTDDMREKAKDDINKIFCG